MTKILSKITLILAAIFIIAACAKDNATPDQQSNSDIPDEVLHRFVELGFDVSDLKMDGENYLVEGDIIITPKALANMSDPVIVPGPRGEQYSTFNLVTGLPRTIVVKGKRLSGDFSAALNFAIDAYNGTDKYGNPNGVNLALTLVRDDNARKRDTDITVGTRRGSAGGVAGFPDGSGDPYNSVTVYSATGAYGIDVLTHVMTHELGHCIGLRHSDWFDRSYSCGSGGSEGQEFSGVGAEWIPGTPNKNDQNPYSPNSVMNSCFHGGSNGELNGDDKTALNFLYD